MSDLDISFMKEIKEGKYAKAKQVISNLLPDKGIAKYIVRLGFQTGSISLYSFICFLIIQDESAYLHHLASILMSQTFSHFEGAFSAGLFHARRAIELAPKEIDCKVYILFYFDIPEPLLSICEAESIAREILKLEPGHPTALSTLRRIEEERECQA